MRKSTAVKWEKTIDINSASTIATATFMGMTACASLAILPMLVGAIVDEIGLTGREAGFIAAADMSGAVISTLWVAFTINRWNWRYVIFTALSIMILGNLASVKADAFAPLFFARLLAGIGNGLTLSIAAAALAGTRNPDRNFGILVAGVCGFGAGLLMVMPPVLECWGVDAVFIGIAGFAIVGMFLIRFFPAFSTARDHESGSSRQIVIWWAAVGLTATLIFFIAQGAVWAYLERLGVSRGLTLETVAIGLAVSQVAAAAGAASVSWLSTRYGRAWPLFIGTACQVGSLVLLVSVITPIGFAIAASIFNFTWNFILPYQMGAMATVDPTGRVVVLTTVVQTIGLAVGPALAAIIITGGNYVNAVWIGLFCSAFSFAILLPVVLSIARRYRSNADAYDVPGHQA